MPVVHALVDTRKEFDDLAGVYLPVAFAVVAIVFGALVFALLRFRRRDDELPHQREEAPRLEIAYAVGLAAVVAVLLTLTFNTQDRVDALSPTPDLRVGVTAAKWNWRFEYPQHGITRISGDTRPTTLVVPSDRTVRFALRSRDVIHAFWIPEVRFKRDAFPHRTTRFDLVFDKPGFYPGVCAEFCGLEHGQMRFSVEVRPPRDFDAWVASQQRVGA
jgi:cytochrome c oxidase subunit II